MNRSKVRHNDLLNHSAMLRRFHYTYVISFVNQNIRQSVVIHFGMGSWYDNTGIIQLHLGVMVMVQI